MWNKGVCALLNFWKSFNNIETISVLNPTALNNYDNDYGPLIDQGLQFSTLYLIGW